MFAATVIGFRHSAQGRNRQAVVAMAGATLAFLVWSAFFVSRIHGDSGPAGGPTGGAAVLATGVYYGGRDSAGPTAFRPASS